MGVWKATKEVAGAVEDNLAAKLSEVSGETGVSLDTAFSVFRRARAESVWDRGSETASVGVWIRVARTGAASQKARDWTMTAVIDYTYRGQDRDAVAEQVELATDALMRVVDLLVARDTVIASGEREGETVAVHDIDDMVQEAADLGGVGPYVAATRIEIPILQREVLP